MSPISLAELTSIRNDVAFATCDLSCQIQASTRTTDAQGGASETWATVATVNAGMSQPTSSQLSNYSYIVGSLEAWIVQFPYGTNAKHGNRLTIAGKTLTVQVDLSPQSYDVLQTVLATAVS